MLTMALSGLFGLVGFAMKPIPFVAAAVVFCTLVAAMTAGTAWLPALLTFYASLALAEVCYVGVLAIRG